MTRKINRLEDYITAHDAAQLLSLKHGRSIQPRYIRQLAKSKKQPVRTQPIGVHKLYHRDDIQSAAVKQKAIKKPPPV